MFQHVVQTDIIMTFFEDFSAGSCDSISDNVAQMYSTFTRSCNTDWLTNVIISSDILL